MDLSAKDAGKLFNVTEETIYRWIEDRGLPARRLSNQLLLDKDELLEWAAVTGTRASPEFLRDLAKERQPLPSLAEALDRGGIFYGVAGTDKDSVLHAVVEMMKLPAKVEKSFLLNLLLAREALGSTGVGEGIAIPHPRNTIVVNVDRPIVTLAFLKNAVDFGALDGNPVSTVFTLVCPTMRAHLHLLSVLAFMLHDPPFKDALVRRAPKDKILAELKRGEKVLGYTSRD